MGSPMVFHTAPPQPASKARMTCSPQLVGGPEASQKGLGQRMPAKSVVRSAMGFLQRGAPSPAPRACRRPPRPPLRGRRSRNRRRHNTSGCWCGRWAGPPRSSRPSVRCRGALQQLHEARLPQRRNHHVAGELELGARHRLGRAPAAGIRLAQRVSRRISRRPRGRPVRESPPAAPASGTARPRAWSGRTRMRTPAFPSRCGGRKGGPLPPPAAGRHWRRRWRCCRRRSPPRAGPP